jgi:hypothetical protein
VTGFVRRVVAGLLVLANLLAVVPAASAQEAPPPRLRVVFTPSRITTQTVGGCAPNTACPLQRGVAYTVDVSFTANEVEAESMVVQVESGGLLIEPSVDTTDALPAGGTGSFTVDVTVPETGDKAPAVAQIGSGRTLTRQVTLNSNFDAEDFDIHTNAGDRVTLTGVPDALPGGQNQSLTVEYQAPIVNRRTRTEVRLIPTSGFQALQSILRIKLVILPVQITWSPPFVRKTLQITDRNAVPVTVTATSNFTISDVTFKTADLGLTPITSHSTEEPVTLQAGVPEQVRFFICPGYAPTQYFLGITAFQGNKPLNRRLQIRSNVENPDDTPIDPQAPDCET